MPDFVDLLITDNDLTLDAGGEPLLIYDADCIAQDIKHLVRESGLLVELIGQRDGVSILRDLQTLTLLVEEDARLIPGSINIKQIDLNTLNIAANTYQYGNINFPVNA